MSDLLKKTATQIVDACGGPEDVVPRVEADLAAFQREVLAEIKAALQAQIDHAAINELRLVPAFGKRSGDPALRAASIEAVIERFFGS